MPGAKVGCVGANVVCVFTGPGGGTEDVVMVVVMQLLPSPIPTFPLAFLLFHGFLVSHHYLVSRP